MLLVLPFSLRFPALSSLPTAQGATAAAMRVVVVPSITGPDCSEYPTPDSHASQGVVELLPSLLAFNPQRYGLPPFNDTILGMIPLEPALHISGAVVKGFGRGSKVRLTVGSVLVGYVPC